MSENHTYVSSEEIIAKEEEIARLEEGNTAEIKRCERQIEQNMQALKRSGDQLKANLSAERSRMLSRVHRATDALVASLQYAGKNASVVQENINAVNSALLEATNTIERVVEEAKNKAGNAEQLYIEAVKMFTATELCVSYQRFAGDMQASIRDRISKIKEKEVAPAAMQMMTTTIIADIYQMDILVAKRQADFDTRWAEATNLVETITAHCNSARSMNFAEVGDSTTEFLDINYWSDGKFNDLVAEIDGLRAKLTYGYNDPNYSTEELSGDLRRLQELNKAKDIIIAASRVAYNQSVMRESQALAAMDILVENHQFSLIGNGFEANDRRESYILRMRRHTDNAEIEVIVSPTPVENEFSMYFRLDTTTYADQSVLQSITRSLAKDFEDAGLRIDVNPNCVAEYLEPFNAANPTISDAARRLHNIPKQKSR